MFVKSIVSASYFVTVKKSTFYLKIEIENPTGRGLQILLNSQTASSKSILTEKNSASHSAFEILKESERAMCSESVIGWRTVTC